MTCTGMRCNKTFCFTVCGITVPFCAHLSTFHLLSNGKHVSVTTLLLYKKRSKIVMSARNGRQWTCSAAKRVFVKGCCTSQNDLMRKNTVYTFLFVDIEVRLRTLTHSSKAHARTHIYYSHVLSDTILTQTSGKTMVNVNWCVRWFSL